MVWTIRSCVMADLFQFEPHGLVRNIRENLLGLPLCGSSSTTEPRIQVGDLVVPAPPEAPRKPAGTHFFGQPPRASVYGSVAALASFGRLFFVACERLPCPL